MIDITLTCNGVDFSGWLSTYEVHKAYEAVSSITTLDGVEHVADRTRDLVIFSLVPFNDTIATAAYNALKSLQFSVTYTDPQGRENHTQGKEPQRIRRGHATDRLHLQFVICGRCA